MSEIVEAYLVNLSFAIQSFTVMLQGGTSSLNFKENSNGYM